MSRVLRFRGGPFDGETRAVWDNSSLEVHRMIGNRLRQVGVYRPRWNDPTTVDFTGWYDHPEPEQRESGRSQEKAD
jgi:hypothetical protein